MASGGFLPILIRNKFFLSPDGVVTDGDREAAQYGLLAILHALTAWNANYLSKHRLAPLYNSGMSYLHGDGAQNEVVEAFHQLISQVPDTPENQKLAHAVLDRIVVELWDDAPTALEQGWSDCKVLTCWRTAELNRKFDDAGQPKSTAHPHITWRRIETGDPSGRAGDWMYHVRLRRPVATLNIDPPPMLFTPKGNSITPALSTAANGSTLPMPGWVQEDPSLVLGMGWEGIYARSNHRPASPEFRAWFTDATGIQWKPLVVQTMDDIAHVPPVELLDDQGRAA